MPDRAMRSPRKKYARGMGYPDLQDGRPPRSRAGAELADGLVPAEMDREEAPEYRPPLVPGTDRAASPGNGTTAGPGYGAPATAPPATAAPATAAPATAAPATAARQRRRPGVAGPDATYRGPRHAPVRTGRCPAPGPARSTDRGRQAGSVTGPQDQSWLPSPPPSGPVTGSRPSVPVTGSRPSGPVTGPQRPSPPARAGADRPGPASPGPAVRANSPWPSAPGTGPAAADASGRPAGRRPPATEAALALRAPSGGRRPSLAAGALPRPARSRRTGRGRTTPTTPRRAWPSPGSRRAHAAAPRRRTAPPGAAAVVARSAATRRGRGSPTRSTRRASSRHGTGPPRAPHGSAPAVRQAARPRPTRNPGTRPSR